MAEKWLTFRYKFEHKTHRLHLKAPSGMNMPGVPAESCINVYDNDPVSGSIHAFIPSDHPFYGSTSVHGVFRGVLSGIQPAVSSNVAFKWARGVPEVKQLRAEAEFYADHLAGLMDLGIVPRCHGYFEGKKGWNISILVLEWCGAVPCEPVLELK